MVVSTTTTTTLNSEKYPTKSYGSFENSQSNRHKYGPLKSSPHPVSSVLQNIINTNPNSIYQTPEQPRRHYRRNNDSNASVNDMTLSDETSRVRSSSGSSSEFGAVSVINSYFVSAQHRAAHELNDHENEKQSLMAHEYRGIDDMDKKTQDDDNSIGSDGNDDLEDHEDLLKSPSYVLRAGLTMMMMMI